MATLERPQPALGTEDDVVLKRILAFLIDAILFSVVFGILSNILASISETLGLLVGGLSIILFFAYFIYFEAEYGQTLGKKVLNVVVVKEDGADCDWTASVIRNLFRIIDGFAFYLVGIIIIFLTDDNQRLGDIVGNTIVVRVAPEADEPPEWSGLVIDEVREEGGERHVVLRNASDDPVDLSEAAITDEADNRFRFAEGVTLAPNETETFHVHDSFTPDADSTFTLTTRDGKEYEIR